MKVTEHEVPTIDGKVFCPRCGRAIPCMATAYGFRAICGTCHIRWTRLRGEQDWVAESHSPMADNRGAADAKA